MHKDIILQNALRISCISSTNVFSAEYWEFSHSTKQSYHEVITFEATFYCLLSIVYQSINSTSRFQTYAGNKRADQSMTVWFVPKQPMECTQHCNLTWPTQSTSLCRTIWAYHAHLVLVCFRPTIGGNCHRKNKTRSYNEVSTLGATVAFYSRFDTVGAKRHVRPCQCASNRDKLRSAHSIAHKTWHTQFLSLCRTI